LGGTNGYQPRKEHFVARFKKLIKTSPAFAPITVQAILAYALIGLTQIMYDETYALWTVIEPELGGLSFRARDIGSSLTYCGASMIVIQMVFFPLIQRAVGTINCYRWAMFMYGVYFLALPNVSEIAVLAKKGAIAYTWVWVALIPLLTIRVFTATFAFTASLLFVGLGSAFSQLHKLISCIR
jgi:hypothetical protein